MGRERPDPHAEARQAFGPKRIGAGVTTLDYLADIEAAYTARFDALVVARPPGAVVLDRTFFYPVGGGQPADHGTLRLADGPSVRVVNVVKSGSSVLHHIRAPAAALGSLAVGARVSGEIDWPRRYRHMRLHTGQHFLSARIYARTERRTSRALLGDGRASIDLDGPLPAGIARELADDAAEALVHPRRIRVLHVPRAEWLAHPSARSGLVPLAEHLDPIRVIEIDGVDRCPCGGTHLRSTEEIGGLELGAVEAAGSGGSRLTFSLREPDRPTPTG